MRFIETPIFTREVGDLRVVYYWHAAEEAFYMLYIYAKAEQADLTPVQLRHLRRIVREEFK